MNIQSVMSGVNYRAINKATATQLYATVSNLPKNTIGENGTILDDLKVFTGRLEKCGTSAVLGHNNGMTKVLELHRCGGAKYCPVCADKVSGERIKKINDSLKEGYNWEKSSNAYMITFTLKNQTDLFKALKLLNKSYRAFYRAGQKRTKKDGLVVRSGGEASKFLGSSKSIEIKRGARSGGWHCHIHLIVFASSRLDYQVYDPKLKAEAGYGLSFKNSKHREIFKENCKKNGAVKHWIETENGMVAGSKLSKEWHTATGGVGVGIDVQPLYTDKKETHKVVDLLAVVEDETSKKMRNKVKYTLKYSIKAGDLLTATYEDTFKIFDGFRGIRSIEYAGFLRKTPVKSSKSKEQKEIDEKQEKENRREELFEFCKDAEIEKVITVGENEEVEGTIGEPQSFALWTLGADIHREFQSKSSKRIAEYRKERKLFFEDYKKKELNGIDYIAKVKLSRDQMRRSVRLLVHERNEHIDSRSGGEYYRIIAETKENDETWLSSIRGLGKEMRVSNFYNEDLIKRGLKQCYHKLK